jgi:NADH dehydrogenase FAD-containing subunit
MEKLVFVGGGHAHLESISHTDEFLDLGLQVTVVSPSKYLYYSGMGPGVLGGFYEPSEIRFNIKKIVEQAGGSFIEDEVISVDSNNQVFTLQSGSLVSYNVASFDVGSYIPAEKIEIKESSIIPVKPIENLLKAKQSIEEMKPDQPISFSVVGGGPSGTEIAANLWRISIKQDLDFNITLITDKQLLSDHPRNVRKLAFESLKKRGIKVIENQKVKKIENDIIYLENNVTHKSDMTFLAIGTTPQKIFENSEIPISSDSAMIVNKFLQSINYPNLFGGGDCINFKERKLDKVGVYAVRENPILLHNIKAFIQNNTMKKFSPQKKYLLILNLGNRKGVLWRGKLKYKGRLAFLLKDFIDKRFMKKYKITS